MHNVMMSQSLQELKNIRHTVEDMIVLGSERNPYIKQLRELQSQQQLTVDIKQLRLVLTINLQRILFNLLQPYKHTINAILLAYSTIIEMEEQIDGLLQINQKIINYKIIQTILDYKICQKYCFQRNFYFQELLPIIQEQNYLQHFYSKSSQQYLLFFLGVMIESMKKKDFDIYAQVCSWSIRYVKQTIERLRKELKLFSNKIIVKQLIILLNLHLSFKLLKKHAKFDHQPIDQSIYVLLYELDSNLNQRLTLDYKKFYNKTLDESLDFVVEKIKSFFTQLQSSIITTTSLLPKITCIKSSQFKIRKSISGQSIKKISLSKQKSFKNINHQKLRIKNNIYVPQKINLNKQLQNKRQFRIQTNKLKINNNTQNKLTITSIKPQDPPQNLQLPTKNSIDSYFKPSNSQDKVKLSYSHCIKDILNTNQQLQLMLCQRPTNSINRMSFQSKNSANKQHSQSIKKTSIMQRRKRANSRMTIRNYSNLKQTQQKIGTNKNMFAPNQLYIPPLINKLFHKYLLSFAQYAQYSQKRQQVPFYSQFALLDPLKYYYFNQRIYQLISIKQQALIFQLKLKVIELNQQKSLSVNLLEIQDIKQIKQLFVHKRQKFYINELFYFGPQISLFKLNLISANQNLFVKHGIELIKYENQIYSYNVYLNCLTITKKLIRKAIHKQQHLMQNINKDLCINFNYDRQIHYHLPYTINKPTLTHIKFSQFHHSQHLQHNRHFTLISSLDQSLKIGKIFHVFNLRLYCQVPTQRYYLVLTDHKYQRYVLSCRQQSINFLKNVRTLRSLKQVIIDQQLLVYQCWNHVVLNQSILQPPSKKHCVRDNNIYKAYYSKTIIQNKIKIIFGHLSQKRWFIIVPVLQPERLLHKNLSNSLSRNSRQKITTKVNRRELKGSQSAQILFNQQMKDIRVRGCSVEFNKQQHKMFNYDYNWLYYQNGKRHYCFKNNNTILDFTIYRKYLMYINKIPLPHNQNHKQSIFQIYKQYIQAKYTLLKKVLFQANELITIQCKANQFICHFIYDTVGNNIAINASQFTSFHHPNFIVQSALLKKKPFKRRLMNLVSGKIRQLNYSIY